MIVLCTYSLQASRTVDMLMSRVRINASIALRNGNWEFLETPNSSRPSRKSGD